MAFGLHGAICAGSAIINKFLPAPAAKAAPQQQWLERHSRAVDNPRCSGGDCQHRGGVFTLAGG